MRSDGRDVPPKVRSKILLMHAAPCAVVGLGSILLLAGYLLFGRRDNRDSMLPFLLIATPVTVAICATYAWVSTRRALHLAAHGVLVVGQVVGIGGAAVKGLVRIDYQYEVDGHPYRKAKSVDEESAERFAEDPEIRLLVDPDWPNRCMLAREVLPPESEG